MRPAGRRAALLTALAVAATSAGLASAPVEAADCPQIGPCVAIKVIKTVDGERTQIGPTHFLTPEDIQARADVLNRQYFRRKNPDGQIVKLVKPAKALSLHKMLADIDPDDPDDLVDDVTFSETPGRADVPVVLSEAELSDPDPNGEDFDEYPFLDGLAPMVYVTDGKIRYVRPLRDAESDTNSSDIVTTAGRLDLTIHTTGRLLEPTANASSTTVTTKDRPTFSVTYGTTPKTQITKIRWDFADGTTSGISGAKRTHQFSRRGTFPVAVSVRGADGSYGRSAPVEIKVDNPPKAPSSGTGGGTGSGGGGTSGNIPPFDSGVVDPPTDDLPPEENVPDDEPTDELPVDDGLEQVEGYVLAGSEIVPGGVPEAIPGTQDSSRPAPATQQSMRQRIATWVVAALAIALLVGAGAASETRWFRHRLRHLRRRA